MRLMFRAIALVFCCWPLLSVPEALASAQTQRSRHAMVVAAHPLASEAGAQMLQQGGNAVDAAVATAFVISVVEPFAAGIGGGGFLLLYLNQSKQIKALDFRERAPLKATATMYLDSQRRVRPNASVNGHLAVAVPGTVAGLYEVHRRYGRLPWQTVLAPAIKLAKQGFQVSDRFEQATERRKPALLQNAAARQVFLQADQPYQLGMRLIQADLGRTLATIARNPQDFYQGTIARAIAADMARQGGLVTLQDLQAYKPIWRDPLCGSFQQVRICSMPPPSSGGVHLLQILNILEAVDLKALGWHHPDALHWLIEAMRIAYADRAAYLGDPAFVEVPVRALTSKAYARQRRQEISLQIARPFREIKILDRETLRRFSQLPDSPETSHLSVVDADRNAVSLTFTVNYGFGSGVVVPGTGILLNNEMDDFATSPEPPPGTGLSAPLANAIAPGKIPRSSMTPTIVTENQQLRLVVGAPGGSTIITTVVQILLNLLVYEMDVSAAVAAPRLHHPWFPDQLAVEPWGFDPLTLQELRRRGHQIEQREKWGNANAILVKPDHSLEGAADPRGEGVARGL